MIFSRRSREKHRKIAAFLAFLLIGAMILGILLPFVTYAAENEDIILNGEIGFNNRYKVGGTTPISLEITNKGEDFKGEIQVKILRQEYGNVLDNIVYAKDVEIPKGSTKKFEMIVKTSNMQRYFDILLADGTKTVAKKTIYATAFPPKQGFVGVLSEDSQSLNYLKDLVLGKLVGNRMIEFNENNFPADINILNDFDAVIINNYDTSKLNKEQIDILNQWVSGGGTLILGTGPNADKVLKGLDADFVSAVHKGTADATDFFEMEQLGGRIFDSKQPLQTVLLEIKKGEGILFSGELPITTLVHKEKGFIIIHHFDLGINPIAQWDGNRYMLTELYRKHIPVFAEKSDKEDEYYGNRSFFNPYVLRLFPRPEQKGLIIGTLIMIIVYIILVGPVLYWVLKIKDKREFGWFIIPLIAFGFSGAAYLFSNNTVFNAPVGSSIGLIYLTPGEISSSMDITAGFFTPDTGESKITFAKDIQPQILDVDDSFSIRNRGINTSEKQEYISAKIKVGQQDELIFYNDQSWALNTVTGSYTVNFAGPIHASLTFKDNKLIGSIQNQLGVDLETCILVAGDQYYYLDQIKNNDTIHLEKEISSSNTKNRYEALDEIFGPIYDRKRMNEKWGSELSQEALQSLVQRREIFQNYSNRYYMTKQASYGIHSKTLYGDEDSSLVLYGFSDEPIFGDIKINNRTIRNYNQNLLIIPLEIDYSKVDKIEIPYGFIKPYITGNIGFDMDEFENIIYIHSSGRMEFTYAIDSNIKLNEFQIQFTKNSSVDGTYIFNNESGVWEELTNLPYEEDVEKYRNSEGKIQVRFDVLVDNQKENRIEVPKLRMKGDKQ